MRRYAHAKREHVISALDALLFELFVLSYFLDPAIIRMLFRATAQLQFARPRDLDRSLRFMFIYCCLINFGPVLRHVLPSFHYEQQGLLLDFVGRAFPPARIHLAFVDVGIFVLQATCLFIAYEAYGMTEQDDLAVDSIPSSNDSTATLLTEEESSNKVVDENEPILHLRYMRSFRKIQNPPNEPRRMPTLPFPNSTLRSRPTAGRASSSPINRFVGMMQARAMQQAQQAQNEAPRNEADGAPARTMPGGI